MDTIALKIVSKASGKTVAEKIFELRNKPLLIGRGKECHLTIFDHKISYRHCQLVRTAEGKCQLIDLGSSNGTFVNTLRVSKVSLVSGDVIKVGNHEIVFDVVETAEFATGALKEPVSRFVEGPPIKAKYAVPEPVTKRKRKRFVHRSKKSASWMLYTLVSAAVFVIAIVIIVVITNKPSPSGIITEEERRVSGTRERDQEPQETIAVLTTKLKEELKKGEKATEETSAITKEEQRTEEEEIAWFKAEIERQKRLYAQEPEEKRKRELEEKKRPEEESNREEEERKKREAAIKEEQRRKQEAARKAQEELKGFKPQYEEFIRIHQYTKAIALSETTLKKVETSDAWSVEIKQQLEICLDEAQRQEQIFRKLIKDINTASEKKTIDTGVFRVKIEKADETYFEGYIEGKSSSKYTRRWADVNPKNIYALFYIWKTENEEQLNLAIFCFNHGLVPEAEKLLLRYYKNNPKKMDLINELLARKRNIPLPPGGFIVHNTQWVTAEEKECIEQGMVQYKGKWMIREEMMIAKGYVKHKGKWITQAKMEKIQAKLKGLEELKNRFAPKGVIDKPGADFEKLSWDQAREKKTEHYIIQTNLSEEALNDICYVMECLYTNFRELFKYQRTHREKLNVRVFRQRDTYHQHGGPAGSGGVYTWGGTEGKRLMTFYQYLKVGRYHVITPRYTTKVLLHEGTHQFVDIICSVNPPIWIHEGLATYYEASQFDGKELDVNLINRERLHLIKKMIQQKKHMDLKDFINIQQANYHVLQYAQGWSLVYFLINGENGKYVQGFDRYIKELRKRPVTIETERNRIRHVKLFEKVFGENIDTIEKQWKEYILGFVDIICNVKPPIWITEGLAAYYEASQFAGKELHVNLINRQRLHTIKAMIQKEKHMNLKDFINIQQADYHVPQYAQGLSLVYFLINGEEGKYVPGFVKYIKELRKRPVPIETERNRIRHVKLFEKVFGESLDIIEKQWKEYIRKLK